MATRGQGLQTLDLMQSGFEAAGASIHGGDCLPAVSTLVWLAVHGSNEVRCSDSGGAVAELMTDNDGRELEGSAQLVNPST